MILFKFTTQHCLQFSVYRHNHFDLEPFNCQRNSTKMERSLAGRSEGQISLTFEKVLPFAVAFCSIMIVIFVPLTIYNSTKVHQAGMRNVFIKLFGICQVLCRIFTSFIRQLSIFFWLLFKCLETKRILSGQAGRSSYQYMQDQLEHLNKSLQVLKKRPVKGTIGSQGNKGDQGSPGSKGQEGVKGIEGQRGICYLGAMLAY